jgi:hypothetical protein
MSRRRRRRTHRRLTRSVPARAAQARHGSTRTRRSGPRPAPRRSAPRVLLDSPRGVAAARGESLRSARRRSALLRRDPAAPRVHLFSRYPQRTRGASGFPSLR